MRSALSTLNLCSGFAWTIVADTSLQNRLLVRDSAFGLADWGSGSSFSEGGPEGVFQLSPIRTQQKTLHIPGRTPHLLAVRMAHRPQKFGIKQPTHIHTLI